VTDLLAYGHVNNATRCGVTIVRNDFVFPHPQSSAITMSSFELQDEIQALQDLDSYEIRHHHDFSSEGPEALLEGERLSFRSERH